MGGGRGRRRKRRWEDEEKVGGGRGGRRRSRWEKKNVGKEECGKRRRWEGERKVAFTTSEMAEEMRKRQTAARNHHSKMSHSNSLLEFLLEYFGASDGFVNGIPAAFPHDLRLLC